MSSLTVTITGDKQVMQKMAALGEDLYKMQTEFTEIGDMLVHSYSNEVFGSQGGFFGARWPSLKDSTVRQKIGLQKKGVLEAGVSPAAPLIRTGQMQGSFHSDASESTVRVYNDAEYFPYHQLGTSNIPQRMMIGMNDKLKANIASIVKAGIMRKLEGV